MPQQKHNTSISGNSNSSIVLGKDTSTNTLKRVFSVDDEVKDIEKDIKYLEGLQDGLRMMSNSTPISQNSLSPLVSGSNNANPTTTSTANLNNNNTVNDGGNNSQRIKLTKQQSIELLSRALENQKQKMEKEREKKSSKKKSVSHLPHLVMNEDDVSTTTTSSSTNIDNNNNNNDQNQETVSNIDGDDGNEFSPFNLNEHSYSHNNNDTTNTTNINDEDNEDDEDDDDRIDMYGNFNNRYNNNDMEIGDNESIESFTLKERQEAINETHPFGIRIWKPALYKKKRSILKQSIQDIHETTYKYIPKVIRFNNMIWSLTVGLLLLVLCFILGLLVLLLSGFGLNEHSKKYSSCFFKVGLYLFYPFGKVVYIINDENYKEEDRNEGITSLEFYKWITGYKMFKSSGSNSNASASGNDTHQSSTGDSNVPNNTQNRSTSNITTNSLDINKHSILGNNESLGNQTTSLKPYGSMNYGSMNKNIKNNTNTSNNNSNSNSNNAQRHASTVSNNRSFSSNHLQHILNDATSNPTGKIFNKLNRNVSSAPSFETPSDLQQKKQRSGDSNVNQGSGTFKENVYNTINNIDGNTGYEQNNPQLMDIDDIFNSPSRLFGRGQWSLARVVFYVVFYLIFVPIIGTLSILCWLGCFTIPMSNVLITIMNHMRKHPLHFNNENLKKFKQSDKQNNILLCTFRCCGLHYYKYTVDGTNVIVMNLIALVFFTIFDFYVLKPTSYGKDLFICQDIFIFILCLLSTIPLAFYIGQGVASISAQTSMGVGAVINAFFSTIVEIFLYCASLEQEKGLIVEGALIGSILAGVLLLPGLSMCGGAFFRKTQHYNPKSAGVSAAMLIFSTMVMFIPTILYLIYGDYIIDCSSIAHNLNSTLGDLFLTVQSKYTNKEQCHFEQVPLKLDRFYFEIIKPVSTLSAVLLFVVYFIGLLFTLRTHAAMIWALPISETTTTNTTTTTTTTASTTSPVVFSNSSSSSGPSQAHTGPDSELKNVGKNSTRGHSQGEEVNDGDGGHGGHEAPNWSRSKSMIILLASTLAYAMIAEILVDCVDSVLKKYPVVRPKFLGLTIFALVPNTTEFLNAISFAMNGNVALSMEIGSAYVLQVCLLQIPSLVIFSLFQIPKILESEEILNVRDYMFTLVFTRWDFIACIVSVFLFTYLYGEGKSNYFKGSLLIFFYIMLMFGFYLQIKLEEYSI